MIEKEKLEELENIYSKVIQKFPEINDCSHSFFISKSDYFRIISHYSVELEHDKITKKRCEISVEKRFFTEFNEKEKEAMMALVFSAYREKEFYRQKIDVMELLSDLSDYLEEEDAGKLSFFTEREKHKFKRIKDWYIVRTLSMDKKVFEKGYGEHLLSAVKKLCNCCKMLSSEKEIYKSRIENLDKLIEEKS